MARAGSRLSETVPCPGLGVGESVERLISTMETAGGYRTIQVGPDRIQFARSFRPTWATAVAIVLGPLLVGLFFLLVKSTETCLVVVESDYRGTRLRLSGRLRDDALGALRAAFSAGALPPRILEGLGAPVPSAHLASVAVPFASTAPDVMISSTPASVVAAIDLRDAPPVGAPVAHLPAPSAPASGPPASGPPASAPPVSAPPAYPLAVTPADPATPPTYPAPLAEQWPVEQRPAESSPAPVAYWYIRPEDWVLTFDDGRQVCFGEFPAILIGRDPMASSPDERVGAVTVDDPTMTVSKTHLVVQVDQRGVMVVDRGSTNGSTLTTVEGATVILQPDVPVLVPIDATVGFGARSFRLTAVSVGIDR